MTRSTVLLLGFLSMILLGAASLISLFLYLTYQPSLSDQSLCADSFQNACNHLDQAAVAHNLTLLYFVGVSLSFIGALIATGVLYEHLPPDKK